MQTDVPTIRKFSSTVLAETTMNQTRRSLTLTRKSKSDPKLVDVSNLPELQQTRLLVDQTVNIPIEKWLFQGQLGHSRRSLDGKRVLIVSDSDFYRTLLESNLAGAGLRLESLVNATGAMHRYSK